MRKERLSTFKEMLMLKTETLKPDQRMERSTSNGRSSTLMSGRESQERENLMRSSDSMSKETSTLFLNFQTTDISRFMITET
jgi:hypothetical protein